MVLREACKIARMCISPIMIKNERYAVIGNSYSHHSVPCGKCCECRLRRGAGWAFRLQQENKVHPCSGFVTLTYDDAHLPFSDDGQPTLVKSDLQKYFKRVRKREPVGVKYYGVGEYGTKTFRPHYHAIVFSAGLNALVDSWEFGRVQVDPVNDATIGYVCGYVNKPHVKLIGREPEFNVMSQGLGKSYITSEVVEFHRQNSANYVVLPGGIKKAMPRYYRDKIFDEWQREEMSKSALAKVQLLDVEGEIQVGFHELERLKNEAKKAAIKRQLFNSKNRKEL